MVIVRSSLSSPTRRVGWGKPDPNMGLSTALTCSIFLVSFTAINAADGTKGEGLHARNEAVQKALDSAWIRMEKPEDLGNLEEIPPFSDIDKEEKVHQLIIYVLDSTRETRWAVPIVMSERLGLGKNDLFEAVLPLLDSGSREVAKVLDDWALNCIEGRGNLQDEPDYSIYQSYLKTHKGDDTPSLVKRMFMRSPGTAFDVMCDVYVEDATERNRLKGEMQKIGVSRITRVPSQPDGKRVVPPDVEETMQGLARSPFWWARLYVAEIMRRTFRYSNDALRQQLKEDVNEIVRERASAIPQR